MTREETLYSMRMVDLAKVADKLGVKINKKGAKSEAVKKVLAAEMMDNTPVEPTDDIVPESLEEMIPAPSTEVKHNEEHASNNIDDAVLSKFVKKAQKLITFASHDKIGYHIVISYNGKVKDYHDKNLQNIKSAIGHIYRGEETI